MRGLRRAGRETFRSLSVRNFRLFFGGQFVSQVGNWLTLIAQALLVLKLTDSGIALGALAAAQFGPVLLFGAFAGLVADRSDKRRLLIAVQAFAMVESFALAALALMGRPPVAAIFAVAVAGGFATAFDNPTRRSFVVEMVPEEHINNAVSLNSALMTGSRVVGPALAGLLITVSGFALCFLVDGLSYLAVIAALWAMRPAELYPAPVTPRGRGQVRAGLRYARSSPELWVPLVMMTIVGTLAYNFSTVLPLFAKRDLHGDPTLTYTLLMAVLSSGSLVGALAVARRTTVTVRSIAVAAIAFGAAMAGLAVAPDQPAAFVVAFIMGITSIGFMTTSTAIVQLRADPSMRGRVLALQAIVFLGSTPIGGPIAGWVSERYGARWGVGLGAAACVVAGSFGLLALRSAAAAGRRERAVPEVVGAADDFVCGSGMGNLLDPAIAPKAS